MCFGPRMSRWSHWTRHLSSFIMIDRLCLMWREIGSSACMRSRARSQIIPLVPESVTTIMTGYVRLLQGVTEMIGPFCSFQSGPSGSSTQIATPTKLSWTDMKHCRPGSLT
jgi:hypothetical protein